MSEYIIFEEIEQKPKTKVYGVVNKKSGYRIGKIKWYSPWRQYCLFPDVDTIFNKDCMEYIIDFINTLMKEREEKKK